MRRWDKYDEKLRQNLPGRRFRRTTPETAFIPKVSVLTVFDRMDWLKPTNIQLRLSQKIVLFERDTMYRVAEVICSYLL